MIKYKITLLNGETRDVKILKKPVYPCVYNGNAGTLYKEAEQIKTDKNYIASKMDDPHYFWIDQCGYIRGETEIFEIYKGLRNKIVKLELIEY